MGVPLPPSAVCTVTPAWSDDRSSLNVGPYQESNSIVWQPCRLIHHVWIESQSRIHLELLSHSVRCPQELFLEVIDRALRAPHEVVCERTKLPDLK